MSMDPRDMKKNADKVVMPNVDAIGRALGFETGKRLMLRTPVDTGRARANWNGSVGKPNTTERFKSLPGALARLSRAASRFQMSKGRTFYVSNGLPYIERLDQGSSKQAPAGMVDLTVAEMEPVAAQIAAKVSRG